MKKEILVRYSFLAVFWLALFWVGWKQIDTDFGWHVKMGEWILANGIPKGDPFSYTMPSFPLVDHAWLTDAIWSIWYRFTGRWVLAGVYATIALGSILILVPKKLWKWLQIPLFFGGGVLVLRGGIRSQLADWLLVALILKIIQNDFWKKWKWTSVAIIWLWANIHGGYSIGLAILATSIGVRSWVYKKIVFEDVLVWISCVFITLINPYGINLWKEVWMTLDDGGVVKYLGEWLPFYYRAEYGFWLLVSFTVILGLQVKLRIEKPILVVLIGLAIAGLLTLRHMAFLVIALQPVAARALSHFELKARVNSVTSQRWGLVFRVLVIVSMIVFLGETGAALKHLHKSSWLPYPDQAIEFIKGQNYSGKLFSDFGWGGYLIEKYPERKVFMDGRMPIWRWSAPEGESSWAFMDYLKITKHGELGILDLYGVNVVLWRNMARGDIVSKTPNWMQKLSAMIYGEDWEEIDFIQRLQNQGWVNTYQDNVSVVYVRN